MTALTLKVSTSWCNRTKGGRIVNLWCPQYARALPAVAISCPALLFFSFFPHSFRYLKHNLHCYWTSFDMWHPYGITGLKHFPPGPDNTTVPGTNQWSSVAEDNFRWLIWTVPVWRPVQHQRKLYSPLLFHPIFSERFSWLPNTDVAYCWATFLYSRWMGLNFSILPQYLLNFHCNQVICI